MVSSAPIILVGTHRSGTTWLGEVLSRHPDLAYWEEPRHIWVRGNAYRPDDVLTEQDACPVCVDRIRSAFSGYVRNAGKRRLLEKTPSNCLRLPFIRAVMPDARILMVLRDGRAVLRSSDEIMKVGSRWDRIFNRMMNTPVWEWPALFPLAAETMRQKITGKPMRFWGPRPPGWKKWVRSDPQIVILAKQWAATVSRAYDDGLRQPPGMFHVFRYEDLLQSPRPVMEEILDFAQMPRDEDLLRFVEQTVRRGRADAWRAEYDNETLELIRPHMEPTLQKLGYQW